MGTKARLARKQAADSGTGPPHNGKPASLHAALIRLPEDFETWGNVSRDDPRYRGDCSCGCRFYFALEGSLGMDWGVCANPDSHRCGTLTWEHQGCLKFEPGPEVD